MAEHNQRIHPVDVERPMKPTAPLMPPGAHPSDEDYLPPPRRSFPVTHSKPPKRRRGCFCRCVCWTVCLVLVLAVLVGVTAGALYLIFKPKIPDYSVDRISIPDFTVSSNLTVTASFNVTVKATNPNRRIGIYYLGGNHLRVWYDGTKLCEGQLPAFYQGHRNTTVLDVVMTGRTHVDSSLLSKLKSAESSNSVPIDFRGKVPVKLKLGSLKLFKIKSYVRCHLVVSSLTANEVISIKNSDCNFKFRL